MDILLLIVGLTCLWGGTELAIGGAAAIARRWNLSEFIVGIAVLSIGSDLPELTVAVDAGIRRLGGTETSDLVVGAAIGSCLGQIGLVLGVAGLIGKLHLPRRMLYLHGGVLLGSVIVLALTAIDGVISGAEGSFLLIAYGAYLVRLLTDRDSYELLDEDPQTMSMLKAWLLVVVGLVIVTAGAELTVHSAIEVARALGVNQALIAIVVIGIGTSLPELSISVGAMLKQRTGMSVGNLIGSNIFDTLVPIGVAAAIAGLNFDSALLRFDLVFLFALSLIVLAFLLHRHGMQRYQAAMVLALYLIYVLVRSANV